MSTEYAGDASFRDEITFPSDGDDADVASIVGMQQLAKRTEFLELNAFVDAIGFGWRAVTMPGAVIGGFACAQIPVTAEGGPTSIICGVGTDVMYMSEDEGTNWTDKETTAATLRAVAIGAFLPMNSGWVALAVGDAGKFRLVYRDKDVDVITAITNGDVAGTPNLTRVIYDEPARTTVGLRTGWRFWACSPDGLYKCEGTGELTVSVAWTQVSEDDTHDVVVLPSGRVVAWQTIAGVSRLAYTDDGTTMVAAASMAAYGTTTRRLVWDEFAERIVLSDGVNKLAISTDSVTIASDYTYSALSTVTVWSWRGRALIFHAYSTAAPSTGVATIFVRRAAAWSFAITDPTLFRSVNAQISGFMIFGGACRFVSPRPGVSGGLLVSSHISPRV